MSFYYPSNLPEPTITGNNMDVGQSFTKVEFDSGFRYRRSANSPMILEFAFQIISHTQMNEFIDFYHRYLQRGVQPFYATWEVSGFSSQKLFRFADAPSVVNLKGNLYAVTAKFELHTTIAEMIAADPI